MDPTEQIRLVLEKAQLNFTETNYSHYSVFRVGKLTVETLGFEEEPQEEGDVFVNRPFYDDFFGAMGATRLGIVNINSANFENRLLYLLQVGD